MQRFARSFRRLLPVVIIAICMFAVTSCNMQGVTGVFPASGKITENSSTEETLLVDITMEGGTGKASLNSPVTVIRSGNKYTATLVWSSKNYDYVLIDDVKYPNENPGGYSTFTVPVKSLEEPFRFTADTVAMSKPHEIEYTITWHDVSAGNADDDGYGDDEAEEENEGSGDRFGAAAASQEPAAVPDGLKQTGEVSLSHAKGFEIKKYDPYSLVTIYGVGSFLIVPEGEDVPSVGNDITVLKQPFDGTYLVSTSAMDLVRELGTLESIRFSPLQAKDWDIPEVKDLMDEGRMKYAGKYRMPDYELLVSEGCDLAVENTMIYHDPEVIEKLEELGIPVIVETSSYEADPLGRLEWIKLYGVLFGREEEAERFYDAAVSKIESLGAGTDLQKTVACFYVSATGMINVRGSGDYMADMIRLAGGRYVPEDDKGTTSSVNMQMEDFYAAAGDADVLLYNGTIDGELESADDLIAKNSLFSDFGAVKSGNVYCLKGDLFRHPTDMAVFIEELKAVLSADGADSADSEFKYILGPVR